MIESPLPLDICREGDHFYDYCMWPYEPRSAVAGKWHSSNLLFQSFAVAGVADTLIPVCQAIRQAIGGNRTVWGVKYAEGRLSWEFYFYDYERLERQLSLTRLLEILRPFIRCDLQFSEQRPYFMFSIDLDGSWAEPDKLLDEVSLYMGNIGNHVSSGISYKLTEKGLAFDNLYYFFDAKKEFGDAMEKLACSAHLDLPGLAMSDVVWPEMRDCGILVVANKRHCEGIYYGRVGVEKLLWAMQRMEMPLSLREYVAKHQDKLDHLLFDVGIDYRMVDGEIQYLKSAYYGVF